MESICKNLLEFLDPIHSSIIERVKLLSEIEFRNTMKAYNDGFRDGLSIYKFDDEPLFDSSYDYANKNLNNDKDKCSNKS
jgi:hypothetical protein